MKAKTAKKGKATLTWKKFEQTKKTKATWKKIKKIEVVREGDVRRAKLYYLRKKVGKAAKIKEKAFR